jgi:hypothetical protein
MSDFDNKRPNQQYSVYLASDDWIRSRENSLGVIQVSKWMLKDDGFLEAFAAWFEQMSVYIPDANVWSNECSGLTENYFS